MPKVSQERIKYLWTISSIIGITIIAVGIILPLLGLYIQQILLFTAIFTPTDFFVLGLLVIITPPASAYFVDQRWRNGIDNNLPQLLRDISDAQRTGLSLPRAILESSKREYGPLTAELQKMAAKISWGVSFREAMQALSETADTPLVRRASVLILEAERFGGAAEDVFESAQLFSSLSSNDIKYSKPCLIANLSLGEMLSSTSLISVSFALFIRLLIKDSMKSKYFFSVLLISIMQPLTLSPSSHYITFSFFVNSSCRL